MITKKQILPLLVSLRACSGARTYVEEFTDEDFSVIWNACPRGDWLVWFLGYLDRKLIQPVLWKIADRAVRVHVVAALLTAARRKPDLTLWADQLRDCPQIIDVDSARAAQIVCEHARNAAYAAADADAIGAAAAAVAYAYAAHAHAYAADAAYAAADADATGAADAAAAAYAYAAHAHAYADAAADAAVAAHAARQNERQFIADLVRREISWAIIETVIAARLGANK